jgi:hypothetical protein
LNKKLLFYLQMFKFKSIIGSFFWKKNQYVFSNCINWCIKMRRTSWRKNLRCSFYENGGVSDSEYAPASKRYLGYSGSPHGSNFLSGHSHPSMMMHPGSNHPAEMGGRSSVLGTAHTPSAPSTHFNPFLTGAASGQGAASGNADEARGRCGDDEWKNIHVVSSRKKTIFDFNSSLILLEGLCNEDNDVAP